MKDSPIPYVLIGTGVGWLILNSRGDDARVTYKRQLADRGWSQGSYREGLENWDQEGGQSWSEGVSEVTSRTRDAASRTRERIGQYSHRAQGSLDQWIRQNPLAFGVAALAVGAALGLSIPGTDTEHEWMGETRDSLVDKAQELKDNAVETIQETISGTNT